MISLTYSNTNVKYIERMEHTALVIIIENCLQIIASWWGAAVFILRIIKAVNYLNLNLSFLYLFYAFEAIKISSIKMRQSIPNLSLLFFLRAIFTVDCKFLQICTCRDTFWEKLYQHPFQDYRVMKVFLVFMSDTNYSCHYNTHTRIYIYIYIYKWRISGSEYVNIYIYICVCVCVCVCTLPERSLKEKNGSVSYMQGNMRT